MPQTGEEAPATKENNVTASQSSKGSKKSNAKPLHVVAGEPPIAAWYHVFVEKEMYLDELKVELFMAAGQLRIDKVFDWYIRSALWNTGWCDYSMSMLQLPNERVIQAIADYIDRRGRHLHSSIDRKAIRLVTAHELHCTANCTDGTPFVDFYTDLYHAIKNPAVFKETDRSKKYDGSRWGLFIPEDLPIAYQAVFYEVAGDLNYAVVQDNTPFDLMPVGRQP